MEAHVRYISSQEAEAEGPQALGQSGLYGKTLS